MDVTSECHFGHSPQTFSIEYAPGTLKLLKKVVINIQSVLCFILMKVHVSLIYGSGL